MPKAPPDRLRKKVIAEFYQTEAGNEPVREWLRSLPKEERQAIAVDVRKTEYGWPLGMPTCKSLGDGLYEVRTDLEDRIARVVFCMAVQRMVLLHGFIKKTEQTAKAELDTARQRKRKLEARLREIEKQEKHKARTRK
jgi:phage-related protein